MRDIRNKFHILDLGSLARLKGWRRNLKKKSVMFVVGQLSTSHNLQCTTAAIGVDVDGRLCRPGRVVPATDAWMMWRVPVGAQGRSGVRLACGELSKSLIKSTPPPQIAAAHVNLGLPKSIVMIHSDGEADLMSIIGDCARATFD